jgi:BTB/POZ domain-containing protein KCTD9
MKFWEDQVQRPGPRNSKTLQRALAPAIARRIMLTTIQVSDCRFITDPSTWVGESTFFNTLFSGQWGDKQDDGSYFVDADADLFKHILHYLRRGILPFFYDRMNGHNYALYNMLLEEARFFGIDRLEKWLSEKNYLEVVKVVHSVVETDNLNMLATPVNGDVEIVVHPMWKKKIVYYCPDAFRFHKKPNDCSDHCFSRTTFTGQYVGEQQLIMTVIKKQTIFDHQLCIQGR